MSISIGDRFTRLLVIKELEKAILPCGQKQKVYECVCDCGTVKSVRHSNLKSGTTMSCGCYAGELRSKVLPGEKYGRLTTISFSNRKTTGGHTIRSWECLCDCGKVSYADSGSLTSGHTQSCGCYKSEIVVARNTTHGQIRQPAYNSWRAMRERCYNPNSTAYTNYGGKGVVVCDRWRGDEGFQNFLEDMGERPEGMSINRINGAKIYSKETCEWATNSLQGFDKGIRSSNTSGKTGINWDDKIQRWRTSIRKEGQAYYLGVYRSFEEAAIVRNKAELEHYGFNL